jgi:hypothetical protein
LGKDLIKFVRNDMSKYSLLYRNLKPDIRLAALGDDAVAIGGAVASGEATSVNAASGNKAEVVHG